jgi:hypothetical protein
VVFEEFQKNFSDRFNGITHSVLGASADFSDFLIAEIIESMEQKPLPLLLGAESQHRQDFPAGFHAAHILLRRFAAGQTSLGDNYVLVIAALVPMVFPLTVKAPVKLLGYHPKFVKGGGIIIGQIAPMLSDGNSHPAFSFRSDFCWDLNERGGERQRGRCDWPGNAKAPGRHKAIRVQVTTL